ncbi:hypothetical protein [Tenacibaculum soleae]|uniref:hypothetical protein n=1 Tax=Tenacibaculum soleae TaxID=447689 RepID=UPI002301DAF7|nr:hypothetical protein [Tenacibaculum soleae]
MATAVKQNGTAKKQTATKATVQKKLAEEAIGKPTTPITNKPAETQKVVNLDDRIQNFEKLRGLANQRERLVQTLNELTKFNYNQGDSSSFYIKDASGLEFKTTNSNLIKLVANNLQATLENRKVELEKQILEFQL